MKTAFTVFQLEFEKLMEFLETAEVEGALIGSLLAERDKLPSHVLTAAKRIAQGSTNWKRYIYSQTIIIMYGALERYIEESIREYVQQVRVMCPSFSELPEAIQSKHSGLSIDYLYRLKEGRLNHVEDKEIDNTIHRLYSCVQSEGSYQLNDRAFALQSGNVSVKRIRLMLGNIGMSLPLERLGATKSFQEGYQALYGFFPDTSTNDSLRRIFAKNDELVLLRNEIAHGLVNLDNIEDISLLKERAKDVRNFVGSLSDLMELHFVSFCCDSHLSSKTVKPIAVYNNSIVCVDFPKGTLTIGDYVAMPIGQEDIRFGQIESIQINGEDVDHVKGTEGLQIGFKVGFQANVNRSYCFLPPMVRALLRNPSFQFPS